MKLSNKKLKFIRRNTGDLSPEELAAELKVPVKDVEKALKEMGLLEGATPSAAGDPAWVSRVLFFLFALFAALAPFFIQLKIYDFSNLPQMAYIQVGVLVFLFLFAVAALARKRFRLSPTVFAPPVWAFLIWALISLLWARNDYEAMTTWVHWAACGLALVLAASLMEDRLDARALVIFLFASGVAVVAVGVIQFMEIDRFFPVIPEIPQVYPPSSTFANKNMAVHYVILTLPLGLGLFLSAREEPLPYIYGGLTAVMTAFLFYTGTRAGWVALFLEAVVFGSVLLALRFKSHVRTMDKNRWIALGASAALFFLFFNLGPGGFEWRAGKIADTVGVTLRELVQQFDEEEAAPPPPPVDLTAEAADDDSLPPAPAKTPPLSTIDVSQELRWAIWKNTLVMIGDHPLIGVGLGNHKVEYPLYTRSAVVEKVFSENAQLTNAHNDYVQAAAELGLVGMALLAWLFVTLVWVCVKLLRDSENPDRLLILGVATGIAGLLVNAFFSFPFQRAIPPFTLMLYLALMGFWFRRQKGGRAITVPWPAAAVVAVLLVFGIIFAVRAEARLLLADWYYLRVTSDEKLGRWDKVIKNAENAYALNPHRKKTLSYMGRAYIETGKPEEGIVALKQVVEAYPNHMNALLNLGVAYGSTGQYEKAIEVYDHVLRIKPDYAKAHNNVANVFLKQGQMKKALRAFRLAGLYDPASEIIQFNIGVVAVNLKEFDIAETAFRRAVQLKPDWAVAQRNLGMILLQQEGKKEEAMVHLRKAMELEKAAERNAGGSSGTVPQISFMGPGR